jgi:hypothetical protein
MHENNWTMVDWYCLYLDEVNRNLKLGEPV